VASRLARARERLRVRLTRRGLALSAGALAAGLSQAGFSGAASEGLVRHTGRAAAALAAGRTAVDPAISGKSIALSREVLRAMFIRKLTRGAAILVAVLVALGGGLVLRLHLIAGAEAAPPKAAAAALPAASEGPAAPVTVCRPVPREVVPSEEFPGRLVPFAEAKRRVLKDPPPAEIGFRFDMDERTYLRYQRLARAGKVKKAGAALAVGLSDETDFPHAAVLSSFDGAFAPDTGTIGVLGVLPNEDDLLRPGMFVRVRVTLGPPAPALAVPEGAIGHDQGVAYLWVVGDRDVAERRAVKTGVLDGGLRVIEEGLRPEDRVVIAGAKELKPGDRVEPRPADPRPAGAK
jgi:multidrug efflux pump subunit AcrA (membrane-fusion protein)